jgi:hypothetical protein
MGTLYDCLLLVVLPLSVSAGQLLPDNRDSLQDKEKLFSVFLIGDAGAQPLDSKDGVITLLTVQLAQAGEKGSVIFLGNNPLPKGHALEEALENNRTERLVPPQLAAVKHFRGKPLFIPGNNVMGKRKEKRVGATAKRRKVIRRLS